MSEKGNLGEKLVKQIITQDFNEDSWRGFLLNCLRKGEIKSRVAVELSGFLFGDSIADDKHKLCITAIADCLEYSTEFVEHFETLDADTINNALDLNKYFTSDDIVDDSEDSEDSDSIMLRIIRLIHKRCKSYQDGNLIKFKDLGLTQEKFQVFKKCVDTLEKEELSLANVLNNLIQNNKFNFKLNTFAKLSKVLEDDTITTEELRKRNENRIKEAKHILEEVFLQQKNIIENKYKDYELKLKKFKQDSTKRKERLRTSLSELEEKTKGFEIDGADQRAKKRLEDRINRMKENIESFPENEKLMEDQFTQQMQVIEELRKIHNTSFKCISALLESSQPLENHSHVIQDIYEKIISTIEVPVALIVIGLVKTGKSTIVNKLLGQDLSPHRTLPMTAIPVRYINVHPEEGKESRVEMVVPFSSSLNKIIRILKNKNELLSESDRAHTQLKSVQMDAPPDAKYPGLWKLEIHILQLLVEVSQGLRFKRRYLGKEEVLKVSEQIHDFFRLCVQEPILQIFEDEDLIGKLPLNWTKGLDNFLAVSLPLPDFDDATNIVDFSVVDTPGVNETGVELLKLKEMVIDSAKSCHYLAFTINLKFLNNTDDEKLIRNTVQKLKDTPTIIFGTQVDQVQESGRDELKHTIQNFVRREENPIPPSNIHLVSGVRGSIATQMLSYINENNRKPSPTSNNQVEKKLAKDFIFYGCDGSNEQRRLVHYNNLRNVDDVKVICRDLLHESNMEEPIQQMKEVGVMKGIILSLFFTLEKREKIEDLKKLIQDVIDKQTKESQEILNKKRDIESGTIILENRILEIRKNQKQISEEFVLEAKKDLNNIIERLFESSELPEILRGGQKEFKLERKKSEISREVQEDLTNFEKMAIEKVNKYLGELSNKFSNWSNRLKIQLKDTIIDELSKILSQQITNPDVGEIDFKLSFESLELVNKFISQEQRTTTSKLPNLVNLFKFENPWNVKQNVIVVDGENLRKGIKERTLSRINDILPALRDKTRKMVNQLVESFFLRAILYLNEQNQLLDSRNLDENQRIQIISLQKEYEENDESLFELLRSIKEKHFKYLNNSQ